MDGRVFGLDLQLGFDVICQAICIFLLFFLLSYILYEPVKKTLTFLFNHVPYERIYEEMNTADTVFIERSDTTHGNE